MIKKKMETDETKIAVLVEKVGNMNSVLVKLDTKIDTLNDKSYPKDQGIALEKRVNSLEDWRIWVVGAAAGVSTLIVFLKDWLMSHH